MSIYLCMHKCAFMHLRPEFSRANKTSAEFRRRSAQICCSLSPHLGPSLHALIHFSLCSRQQTESSRVRSNDMSEPTTRSDAQSPRGEETAAPAASASNIYYLKQSQLCSRRLLMGANVSWRAGLWTQSIINIISLIASRQVAKHGLAISRWGKLILIVMQYCI